MSVPKSTWSGAEELDRRAQAVRSAEERGVGVEHPEVVERGALEHVLEHLALIVGLDGVEPAGEVGDHPAAMGWPAHRPHRPCPRGASAVSRRERLVLHRRKERLGDRFA